MATDRDTGSSRGFGFVTFEDPRDADDAIRQLDNSEFMVSESVESVESAARRSCAPFVTSPPHRFTASPLHTISCRLASLQT